MNGKRIGAVLAAGVVAFAAAFGIAKASGGDDGATTPSKAKSPTARLKAAERADAKVDGVDTGGAIATFKPAKKKPTPTPTAVVTATVAPDTGGGTTGGGTTGGGTTGGGTTGGGTTGGGTTGGGTTGGGDSGGGLTGGGDG